MRVPLIGVGEGISQALPVLTILALAKHGRLGRAPIIAIEQPELHLHPAAEMQLASAFTQPGWDGARFVLETHSENLLLGVQLAVLEGRLRPDDVAVYWIERAPDGRSAATQIEITQDGARRGWPPEYSRRLSTRLDGSSWRGPFGALLESYNL